MSLPSNPELSNIATWTAPGDGVVLDDRLAVVGWLEFVRRRNLQTFRSYIAEARRFRIYLETVHAHSADRSQSHLMRDATEKEIADYEAVLRGRYKTGEKAPVVLVPREILVRHEYGRQPFVTEVALEGVIHPRPIALKASSANQALTILHAMYQHWMQPDPVTKTAYVGANPVRRVKSSSNRMQRQTSRNFPMGAVEAMMESMDLEAAQVQESTAKALTQKNLLARRRWIVALFFGLWGRRSEIAGLLMSDFVHNGSRWMVRLQRKGGKEQSLPVAPWVIKELSRYRISLGMTPLPNAEEIGIPAMMRLRRYENDQPSQASTSEVEDGPVTLHSQTLYREIKAAAKSAAAAIREGLVLVDMTEIDREMVASRLDDVSPHWFRHSGASMAINTGAMSLENASKMLGHSSTTITSEMYHHPDEAQIEEGMQNLGEKTFS